MLSVKLDVDLTLYVIDIVGYIESLKAVLGWTEANRALWKQVKNFLIYLLLFCYELFLMLRVEIDREIWYKKFSSLEEEKEMEEEEDEETFTQQ